MTFDCRFTEHEMYRTIAISIELYERMKSFDSEFPSKCSQLLLYFDF